MFDVLNPANSRRIWQIGALVRAIADALQAKFNPVAVQGELLGFSRASSGHSYFTLREPHSQEGGQIRCAMFRRAAGLLDFEPRDGQAVEVRGRLEIYGPRGDLQLIVESMVRVGAGTLFEEFLRLKARLQAEGLFEESRKRRLPTMPRGIGIVTSLGAAALADVLTTLRRRVPHIPVVVANATVQGSGASSELGDALSNLYRMASASSVAPVIDVILLVRGGGAMEDLWAFNDEALARRIAASPVPIISGVGHETDFTISDFVADVRAPTPTAAAELAAVAQLDLVAMLDRSQERLGQVALGHIDREQERIDYLGARLSRPQAVLAQLRHRMEAQSRRMAYATPRILQERRRVVAELSGAVPQSMAGGLSQRRDRLDRLALRLEGIDPHRVLQRGYAWLTEADGRAVTRAAGASPGQSLLATLSDGRLDLRVVSVNSAPLP